MTELAASFELGVPVPIPRLGFGAMHLPGRRNGPGVDRATAVVSRRDAHLSTLGFDGDVHVGGVRVADGIRQRLLNAAEDRVGEGDVDAQIVTDGEVYARGGDAEDQRAERA